MIEDAQVYDHMDIYHLHYYHTFILCTDTQLSQDRENMSTSMNFVLLIAK